MRRVLSTIVMGIALLVAPVAAGAASSDAPAGESALPGFPQTPCIGCW